MYTCPMHPKVRQDGPGICPICGMALEPEMPGLDYEDNPELRDFSRRFWWTLPATVVVLVPAMFGHYFPRLPVDTRTWIELVLTIPVVLWAGRSEEHTSELQSLMRISYAVFCLKKKKLTFKYSKT